MRSLLGQHEARGAREGHDAEQDFLVSLSLAYRAKLGIKAWACHHRVVGVVADGVALQRSEHALECWHALEDVVDRPRVHSDETEAVDDRLVWESDFDKALESAKTDDKMVLVDFYTDWCGWCKRLDRDVFSKESFQKAASGVVGVKVNGDKKPKLRDRFAVKSYADCWPRCGTWVL